MELIKNSIQKLGISTGVVTGIALIGYFLLMKALNMLHIPQFSFLNFFILLGGIIYAYNHYKTPHWNIDYLSGAGLGVITTAVSVIPYSMFLYIYFSYIDPTLLETLKSDVIMGEYLTPFSAAGAVLIAGINSGVIISFVLMQYYKARYKKLEGKMMSKQG